MPSFASPQRQAEKAVARVAALGDARHGAEGGHVHSVGTARSYTAALTRVAEWDAANGGRGLARMDTDRARAYLDERAEQVSQSTLDQERQALGILPRVEPIERVRSTLDRTGLAEQGRAYTAAQVRAIAEAQTERNALATEIACSTGVRAHELHTLRPATERPASTHRSWSPDRFAGREDAARYTVVGKGGLVREVAIPREQADRLETLRRETPQTVTDRGIPYESRYAIGGGQAWAQSVSDASRRELGYSTGAHGLRHSYAQERMTELQRAGRTYTDALRVVSEEMGHFRPQITEVYLR